VTRFSWKDLPFVLAVFGFAALGVEYLNEVFTTSTRWVFLLFLALWLIWRGEFLLPLRAGFLVPWVLSLVWYICAIFWSPAAVLSGIKVAIFALTSWTFCAGGMAWVAQRRGHACLDYLMPIAGLAVLSGMVGTATFDVSSRINRGLDYQNLAGHPNFIGLLATLGIPFALYSTIARQPGRGLSNNQLLAFCLVALLLFINYRMLSRAAILCSVFVILFFLLNVKYSSIVKISFAGFAFLVFAGVAAPSSVTTITQALIYKDIRVDDVFLSRRDPWEQTLEAAENAGLIGVGFGISAGTPDMSGGDLSFWLSRNLSSAGVGREKGNSQLAIWEETGLVGLIFYAALILNLLWLAVAASRRSSDRDIRIQLSLTRGLIVGLIAHSAFEAWWSSAGSLESANFWAVIGVHAGLLQFRRERRASEVAPSPVPQQVGGPGNSPALGN